MAGGSLEETQVKDQLQRRLRCLWTLELANALFFFPLFYYVISLNLRLGWFSLVSLIVVCAELVVGAAFWFLKSRALAASEPLSRPDTRRTFHATKLAFAAALPVLFALFVVRAFVQHDASPGELLVGGGLMIMALLEYINYYHVQLSYDNRADLQYLLTHRRLKRAVMVRDLGI